MKDKRAPGYLEGENLEAFCMRTAKRNFPDLPKRIVMENLCELQFQGIADYICACCSDGSKCPYQGHQPFLRVDPIGGYLVPFVESEKCYKYKQ